MKTLYLLIGIVAALLLLSTAICGFWIRANNITDLSAIDFHVKIASLAVAFGMLSVAILIRLLLKKGI